ncbi:MAG: hypothetical protein LQ345_000873 [Seirophora villosa]|nr:MAG: hypothetical protein LQ345_000873 [Seirophora villosa]
MAFLRRAKKDLRRLIRQKLSQVSEQSVQTQSLLAQGTLLSLPEYHAARRIGIYLSMPKGELATGPIVTEALRQGKEVYVPYIHKAAAAPSEARTSVMDMVSLHAKEDFERLEADSWGIPTPSESSIAGRKRCLGEMNLHPQTSEGAGEGMQHLDVIVMPGMAFDRRLARLGHGKGYYDFFLSRYKQGLGASNDSESKMPFLVGLALEEQILPEETEVPEGPHDWRLNALVIGDRPVLRR